LVSRVGEDLRVDSEQSTNIVTLGILRVINSLGLLQPLAIQCAEQWQTREYGAEYWKTWKVWEVYTCRIYWNLLLFTV